MYRLQTRSVSPAWVACSWVPINLQISPFSHQRYLRWIADTDGRKGRQPGVAATHNSSSSLSILTSRSRRRQPKQCGSGSVCTPIYLFVLLKVQQMQPPGTLTDTMPGQWPLCYWYAGTPAAWLSLPKEQEVTTILSSLTVLLFYSCE